MLTNDIVKGIKEIFRDVNAKGGVSIDNDGSIRIYCRESDDATWAGAFYAMCRYNITFLGHGIIGGNYTYALFKNTSAN